MKISTFILNAFWRTLFAINLFLIVLSLLQALVFVFFFFGFKISLPAWAEKRIGEEIEKTGLAVDFSNATIDLFGNVSMENVAVRFNGTPENFFKAEKICASFWIYPLLDGQISLKSLRVLDARIGPTYADVDKNPIVRSLYLDVKRNGEWWNVNALNMRVGKLIVNSGGFVNSRFDPGKIFDGFFSKEKKAESRQAENASPDKIIRGAAKELDAALARYPELKKRVDALADPMLNLNFSFFGGGENFATAVLVSGGATFDLDGAEAGVKNFKVRVDYANSDGVNKLSARAAAQNFSRKDFPSFENIDTCADIILEPDYWALENIDFAVKRISYDGSEIGNIWLRKKTLDASNWRENWRFFAAIDSRRFGGEFSLDKYNAVDFQFDGKIDAQVLLSRPELAGIDELRQFSFGNGIFVEGAGKISPKTREADVRLYVQADDCLIMNIPVSRVSGNVGFNTSDNVLRATDIRVETKQGWSVDGAYIQNMDNSNYVVQVKGDIRPMAIAHFMEQWWTRVMRDFDFKGDKNFPLADVYVEGTWGKPEYIWCYASASGKNAAYDGADFSDFSLKVLVNPERISLYDVDISAGARKAGGSIEWLYFNDGITKFDEQRILFDSTLNPSELAALGGKEAKDVLDVVQFKGEPHILLNAVLRNPHNNPKKMSDIFNLSADVKGETVVDRAVLYDAKFKARSDTVNTEIDNASFSFCGGSASGYVNLKKTPSTMEFDGNFYAEKMNQAKFTDFLYSLGGTNPDKDSGEPKNSKSFIDGGENGIVTMSISLKGDIDNFEKSIGGGYVNLENSDLIKLNLFGVLSRALSAMKLPFGSFDITYAYSPFEISGGAVKFSKLEMGGPVMQIKGAAAYNFVGDDIDASLSIRPFGGLTMPIVSSVISIINPLTKTVEVTIDGKISDPKVGVNLNPINILQSDKTILKDIRDSL